MSEDLRICLKAGRVAGKSDVSVVGVVILFVHDLHATSDVATANGVRCGEEVRSPLCISQLVMSAGRQLHGGHFDHWHLPIIVHEHDSADS